MTMRLTEMHETWGGRTATFTEDAPENLIHDLKAKIAAMTELTGTTPRVVVYGTFIDRAGELVFGSGGLTVVEIGRTLLTVECDGTTAKVETLPGKFTRFGAMLVSLKEG